MREHIIENKKWAVTMAYGWGLFLIGVFGVSSDCYSSVFFGVGPLMFIITRKKNRSQERALWIG